MSNSVQPHSRQSTRLLCPWDFPDKNTGVGCHCLLWRIKLLEVCNPRKSPHHKNAVLSNTFGVFLLYVKFLIEKQFIYLHPEISQQAFQGYFLYIYICGNWNIPKAKSLSFLKCLIYMLVSRLGINIRAIPQRITPSSAINLVNIF